MVICENEQVKQIGGWSIRAINGPMQSSENEEKIAAELGIKLPTMVFDSSMLELRRANSDFCLRFNAYDALAGVGPADPAIRVRAAAAWEGKAERTDLDISPTPNSSDWTFTTEYAGTISGLQQSQNSEGSDLVQLDTEALRNVDIPIVMFSEVILFEDELDDNGSAQYKVRIVS